MTQRLIAFFASELLVAPLIASLADGRSGKRLWLYLLAGTLSQISLIGVGLAYELTNAVFQRKGGTRPSQL